MGEKHGDFFFISFSSLNFQGKFRRPRMSGRRMSGTSRRFPRPFRTAIFPRKRRKRGQEPELPDLAWRSQTSFSQTSATTRKVGARNFRKNPRQIPRAMKQNSFTAKLWELGGTTGGHRTRLPLGKWGKKKTNKHKEFWPDTPWCASRLSRGHVPSVPWYVPSVPRTFCPL